MRVAHSVTAFVHALYKSVAIAQDDNIPSWLMDLEDTVDNAIVTSAPSDGAGTMRT